MNLDKTKQYTTIIGLIIVGGQMVYQAYQGYRTAKNNRELYQELRGHSVELHKIAKGKSKLPIEEQLQCMNHAQMLLDLSMYGEKCSSDIKPGEFSPEKLAEIAQEMHRDLHQEIRRRGHKKYIN